MLNLIGFILKILRPFFTQELRSVLALLNRETKNNLTDEVAKSVLSLKNKFNIDY